MNDWWPGGLKSRTSHRRPREVRNDGLSSPELGSFYRRQKKTRPMRSPSGLSSDHGTPRSAATYAQRSHPIRRSDTDCVVANGVARCLAKTAHWLCACGRAGAGVLWIAYLIDGAKRSRRHTLTCSQGLQLFVATGFDLHQSVIVQTNHHRRARCFVVP